MTPEDHWSWDLSRWLKATFPIDLDGREAYILGSLEAGPGFSLPDATAWTGTGLDRRLQDRLENLGLWRGPGFAVITQSGFANFAERPTLIHELAHWVEFEAAPVDEDLLIAIMVRDLVRKLEAEGKREPREAPQVVRPKWAGHEMPFIRAACHLAYRAWVPVEDCLVAGQAYALSYATKYRDALGDEPRRLESMPVAEILKTPAPAAFADLWASDTNQDGRESLNG